MPPDDSDGDSSDDDRRDKHRRGRNHNQRDRPRRRQNSPSDNDDSDVDDGGDGPINDSASEDNEVRSRKRLCIKLQKFDGTGSYKSWWAHFQHCASYNRWVERDKLAFLKGALTGNAAQVLWDTDRSTTNSLKKLVAVLKSRYNGER